MIDNIRVLHVISSMGQGGAERQLLELVKLNKNHAICQLTSDNSYIKELKENHITIFDLKIKKKSLNILSLYKLFKVIKYYKPEIINTWMYHSSLLVVLLRLITFNNRIPLIWGLRCSNMEMSHYSLFLKIIIICCKYFSMKPNIIINNSKAGLNFHKKIGFKNKHIIISNGIDTNKFKPNDQFRKAFRNKYKIHKNARVLLCIGRNDPMKDHSTLLKSFKQIRKNFSSVILILAGLGTENIKKINGMITLGPRHDIEHIYAASDIIISSSAFGEGFSNALAEGMSSKLIPIATNIGDSKYILGDVGKIINQRNPKELYCAIKETIKLDNNIFENEKILARMRIINNFSKPKMVSEYHKLYSRLIDKN